MSFFDYFWRGNGRHHPSDGTDHDLAMFRYKKVIGLHARTLPTQKTETKGAGKAINTMTALGMPVTRRIA